MRNPVPKSAAENKHWLKITSAGYDITLEPYTLPLRIRKSGEFFAIEDANGIALAYVCFEDAPTRRALVNRLSGADAKAVAQTIARALTGPNR